MEILYFFSALVSVFLLIFLIKHLFNPKNPPPSPPFSLPVLGHLHLLKKPLHRWLSDLAHRYGPILLLRFGSRNVLVVSSPSVIEECFTKNDIIFANRPRLLAGKHLGYNYTSLVWSSYGTNWRNLRRVTAIEIFSSNRINVFSAVRNEEVRSLVRRLCGGGWELGFRKVKLRQMLFELVLNVMMRIIAGKRYYGGQEGGGGFGRGEAVSGDCGGDVLGERGHQFSGFLACSEVDGFWGRGEEDRRVAEEEK